VSARDLKAVGKPILPRPYAIAVRKGDDQTLRWINDKLSAMKKDGTVTAISGTWLIDTGYYSQTTQAQVAVGCGEVQIMVRCANWNLKPVVVCTNRNASGIVRGFGGQELKCTLIPLLSLAMEKLDIDPYEFLKKNFKA
jgi:xanthine dehydrogenase molybdenum-binding subunit